MKKLVCLAMALLLATLSLAGCGQPASTPAVSSAPASGTSEPAAPGGPELQSCTLTYYYWNEPQKASVDKTIEEFNKVYPNIKIEATVIPWAQYWTKLQTALPTSGGPDLFQINAAHAVDYIPAGLLLPLQPYIERDKVDMSAYVPGITDLYKGSDGQQYAMPKDYDSIALFYNKAMFDAAGVAYPTNDWTWDDLLAAAQKLTTPTQYGFAVDTYMQTGIGNFIFQNGGAVFSDGNTKAAINSPENVETFQFLSDLMYKHKVSPTAKELIETPTYVQFPAEKVAMIAFGSWYVAPLQEALGDKLGVAELPAKKTEASILHGLGYAASANTKYPEEAWAFLNFCAQQQAMEIQSSVCLPAYMGMEQQWVSSFGALDVSVFPVAAKTGVALPVAAKNAAMVDQVMYTALDKIWTQAASVEDALAEAQAAMDAELAK